MWWIGSKLHLWKWTSSGCSIWSLEWFCSKIWRQIEQSTKLPMVWHSFWLKLNIEETKEDSGWPTSSHYHRRWWQWLHKMWGSQYCLCHLQPWYDFGVDILLWNTFLLRIFQNLYSGYLSWSSCPYCLQPDCYTSQDWLSNQHPQMLQGGMWGCQVCVTSNSNFWMHLNVNITGFQG